MATLSFFQRIFASIFGGGDAESEKRRLLHSIAREISKNKYHYYKVNSHEIETSLPKLFYEIYKAISPVQIMFQTTPPATFKSGTIDSFLTDNQHKLYEGFSEANIEALTHTMPVKDVAEKTQHELQAFEADFGNGSSELIDDTYTKLMLFKNFVSYDFYFLLRKFDSSLRERDFNTTPHFQAINSAYIAEDLKNFISVAWALPFDDDWGPMFQVLKGIKGAEPISLSNWKKIIAKLKSLKTSKIFELMIQHISEDPTYYEKPQTVSEHIIETFITQLDNQIKGVLNTVQQKENIAKVDSLVEQIFGDITPEHLKNYNKNASQAFERKNLGSYMYSQPLSYLKAFLLDYTKRDLRDLSDLLLVRGKWATAQLASPMSEAYNKLLEQSPKIAALDESLAEDREVGLKLKTMLPRAEHGNDTNVFKMLLRDANNTAASILIESTQNYVVYARHLKALLEDYLKAPRSELIINWKELEKYAEGNIKSIGVNAYKKIYLFVQLIQSFDIQIQK